MKSVFKICVTPLRCFRHTSSSFLRFACVVNPLEGLPSHIVVIFYTFDCFWVVELPMGEESPTMSPTRLRGQLFWRIPFHIWKSGELFLRFFVTRMASFRHILSYFVFVGGLLVFINRLEGLPSCSEHLIAFRPWGFHGVVKDTIFLNLRPRLDVRESVLKCLCYSPEVLSSHIVFFLKYCTYF